MSLSADERQALDAIAGALAEAYPGLAAKLTAFTRLAADGKMPGHEKVSEREPDVMRPRHRGPGVMRPRHRGHRGHDPARGLLLWLALAVALIAATGIGVAVSHGAGRPCTDSFAVLCTQRANPNPSHPAGQRAVPGNGAVSRGGTHS